MQQDTFFGGHPNYSLHTLLSCKWVRGYTVCPNLMLTPCLGILYSLIGPSRGLASCKQSEEQAATWLIIHQGGRRIDHLWGVY